MTRRTAKPRPFRTTLPAVLLSSLAACSGARTEPAVATTPAPAGSTFAVRDTVIASTIAFDGIAEPVQQATAGHQAHGHRRRTWSCTRATP